MVACIVPSLCCFGLLSRTQLRIVRLLCLVFKLLAFSQYYIPKA